MSEDFRMKLVEGEFVLGGTQEDGKDIIARLYDVDIDGFNYEVLYNVKVCEGIINYFLTFKRYTLDDVGNILRPAGSLDIDIEGPIVFDFNIEKTFKLKDLLHEKKSKFHGCFAREEHRYDTIEGWLVAIVLLDSGDVCLDVHTAQGTSQLIFEVTIGNYNEDIYIPNVPVAWNNLVANLLDRQKQLNRELHAL